MKYVEICRIFLIDRVRFMDLEQPLQREVHELSVFLCRPYV